MIVLQVAFVIFTSEIADTLAADINPIGAISKVDLKKFIAYAQNAFELPVLQEYDVSTILFMLAF